MIYIKLESLKIPTKVIKISHNNIVEFDLVFLDFFIFNINLK